MNTKTQQEILSGLPVGLVILNQSGSLHWMNQQAIDLLGDWPLQSSWLDMIHACFEPREDDGHEVSLKNGHRVHIKLQALKELPGELIILNDLTKTRQYEAKRAEQQRLISIGRMSAQLTHQIRTPLATAMLHIDALEILVSDVSLAQSKINKLKKNLEFISQEINQLLSFVRGQTIERQVLTIEKWCTLWLAQVDEWVKKSKVHFDVHINDKQASICIDATAMTGVMTNLIENAVQANATNIYCEIGFNRENQFVITVDDDGHGMSKNTIDQACLPFFTTKAKGTGLGLAVVDGIVQAHSGKMHIDSTEGEGCRVLIVLENIHKDLYEKEQDSCNINILDPKDGMK